jgi:leucyl aminopeptidase (aminopeptidase T)
MHLTQTISNQETIRQLSPAEKKLGETVLNTNCQLLSHETLLIVTDETMINNEASVWFEVGKKLGAKAELLVLSGLTHSGQEPPEEITTACRQADLTLLHTHFSLTHTSAGKAIMASGKRGFSLPGVTREIMMRTLQTDYRPIKNLGDKIQTALRSAKTITITSQAGTKLTARIRQDLIINDGGILEGENRFGNLPAGEVFFAPLEGTTQGVFVIDGSIADDKLGDDEKIILTIKDGFATKIEGGPAADRLRQKLKTVGSLAFNVAEIGIGTNPQANPRGELIEAEKALNTVHLALGNNAGFGGSVNVPIHLDGVALAPTLAIDDQHLSM